MMMNSARAMVFLHGGKQGSWVWDPVIAAIRQQDGNNKRKMIALDVPGCGTKRDSDTAGIRFDDVLKELTRDIAGTGVRDALLVGHSQAGTVLPRLTGALPQAIARTVYVTCCAPLEGQSVAEMMGSGVHGSDPGCVGWPLDPATHDIEHVKEQMFCNDMTAAQSAALFAAMEGDEWPADCGTRSHDWGYDQARDTPATYVIALADNVLPVAWQRRFAQRLGAELTPQIDAGHQPMQTRPHTLAEILRSTGDMI